MTPGTSARSALAALLALALALHLSATPAAADDGLVEVTGTVRGELLPTPLADVAITLWKWQPADIEWEQITHVANSEVTDGDGRLSLQLDAGSSYTLRLTAPGTTYPQQYLGGGSTPPADPDAPDWEVATFVPGGPLAIELLTEVAYSAFGSAVGDEDDAVTDGTVFLFDVTDDRIAHDDDLVGTVPLDVTGTFRLHRLRTGHRYTVLVYAGAYLPTYLGSTTQPELAGSFLVGGTSPELAPITLRRGAAVSGIVTSGGAPAYLVQVAARRWDPVGARWLDPVHFDGLPEDTEGDGSWSQALEPGARYTLYFDTSFASASSGPVPHGQYLGGGTAPPAPGDAAATFEVLESGAVVDWNLVTPRIDPLSSPAVTGTARLGQSLTSAPGTWAVLGVTFARQWLRDGVAIPHAVGVGFTPTVADVGKRISVRVTASRAGYVAEATTSPPTAPVGKAAATTTVALSASSAKFGAKVTATVTVRAVAGSPTGAVTLTLDGKALATKRPAVNGTKATASFTLPRGSKTGAHRIVASAAGTATVLASTSAVSTLKITKAKATLTVKGPKKWTVAKGERPTLTVTVKGTKGGPEPTGKVTVKIGKKTYTKTVKSGKVTIRGASLKARGKVKVTVTYTPKAKTYAKPKATKKTLRVR